MFKKILNWLFGKKASTTVAGIAGGALTGAASVAATGNIDKNALIAGAVAGATGALSGVAGRSHGENTN